MAWNEPGSGGNGRDKDPWGGGGRQEGPPDLDEALRKLKGMLGSLFGKGGGGAGSQGGKGRSIKWTTVLIVAVIIWGLSGIYITPLGERAVVTRFGEYHETKMPGPHWLPRFIDKQTPVNVDTVYSFAHATQMLTRDENIVYVELEVQYRVPDAPASLFNVVDPHSSLRHATESALRQVIGLTTLDQALTYGRQTVRDEVFVLLNNTLEIYEPGINVTDVNMQAVRAPEEVQSAFDDVIKAREDQERVKNQAQTYANGIVPRAQGRAGRILAAAKAYRDRIILNAQGDVALFNLLLPEYRKAPEVTRERLYLETIELIMGSTSKVIIDVDGGNQLMYLPVDKILEQRGSSSSNRQRELIAPSPVSIPLDTSSNSTMSGQVTRQGR